MDNIVFNGIDSRSVGIKINRSNAFAVPVRRVTQYNVPGRNGTVIVDDESYVNVRLDYTFARYGSKDTEAAGAVRRWLCATDGQYHRLEDSRWPEHFRMARVSALEIAQAGSARRGIDGSVSFDCLPERWLKSGDVPISMTINGSLWPPVADRVVLLNPTSMTTYPIIEFDAAEVAVSVRIRQSSWYGYAEYTVAAHDGDIQLDTRTGNAVYLTGTRAGQSANASVTLYLNGPDDFELRAGESQIDASADISGESPSVKIYPRWWDV